MSAAPLFGILIVDRDPLGFRDLPGLVQAWLQDAGGFAAVGLLAVLAAVRLFLEHLRAATAELLAGGATVLAGGTDLMPQSHAGRVKPQRMLLNIRRVAGLGGIALDGAQLVVGTLVTVTELMRDPRVAQHAPLLVTVGEHFASDQIRNAATVGGNLCNASPAGDLLTPLIALDAEVELMYIMCSTPLIAFSSGAATVCSMTSIRPSYICALLAKCRYRAASLTS